MIIMATVIFSQSNITPFIIIRFVKKRKTVHSLKQTNQSKRVSEYQISYKSLHHNFIRRWNMEDTFCFTRIISSTEHDQYTSVVTKSNCSIFYRKPRHQCFYDSLQYISEPTVKTRITIKDKINYCWPSLRVHLRAIHTSWARLNWGKGMYHCVI